MSFSCSSEVTNTFFLFINCKIQADAGTQPTASPTKATPAPAPSASASTSPRGRVQRPTTKQYKMESEDSSDDRQQFHTSKRPAPRSNTPQASSTVKRVKQQSHVDPLDSSEPSMKETVTVVEKQTEDSEFIDLPIDTIPTKSEPEYADDTAEVEAVDQEGEATYVEDDTYGEIKYDESYFTENDETNVKSGVSGFGESFEGDQSQTEAQG